MTRCNGVSPAVCDALDNRVSYSRIGPGLAGLKDHPLTPGAGTAEELFA